MADVLHTTADGESTSKYLESYIQSGNINFLIGSGASFPAIPVAGNIETEIDTLLANGDEEAASCRCLTFVEQIDAVHSKMAVAPEQDPVHGVVASYKAFLTTIDRILFARKNILLPRQATVFTTNYDMFLEHASSLVPSVILNDGFERSSSLNPEFMFTPERYFDRTYRSGPVYGQQIEIPTINLVKLHGSLSWRRKTDSIVFDPTAVLKLSDEQKGDINEVNGYLSKHFLILPNLRKHHTTLMERVYYDLLRLFSKAMDQENTVLIAFGFSFADEHLLDLTRRALRNPTTQLIVFSFNHESAAGYQAKFSKQRNVAVVAPAAGESIDFNRFNNFLASILPGQGHAF
ncbi:SIR2 family protein [Nitratireductor sp. ZSWI3]|uniref:SIR2 family protein n=1 Tax=Nitratireductor sp. ZSWI3 TaxID=2966359 RepID=UPI0021502CC7|nr:SIR2 family protein [Nitratireductor sp. ZSWI3]MCR4266790.1 SIR2 family protein [Nitratireductor sp. ZSWI3]